jgi:hypothetical protein
MEGKFKIGFFGGMSNPRLGKHLLWVLAVGERLVDWEWTRNFSYNYLFLEYFVIYKNKILTLTFNWVGHSVCLCEGVDFGGGIQGNQSDSISVFWKIYGFLS